MTIQTPEAEAPAMTRREAYNTMIENARTLHEMSNLITERTNQLNKLQAKMPNFHSASSFEEVEEQELLEAELRPQVDALKTQINDMKVEQETLRAGICDILREYGFDRFAYIFFDHNGEKITMHVRQFITGESNLRINNLRS